MKKDEFLKTETTEANIELNERMNGDNDISYKRKVNSVTEANMAIQEAFYGDNNEGNILPTYIANNTPAININPKK